MKFLDKLALKLFSIIVLVICVVIILVIAEIVPVQYITDNIKNLTQIRESSNMEIFILILGIIILLALKGIFFTSKKENTGKDGIILENASGKLVISKESLENMIAAVAKEIPGAESISSRTIVDKNKNLIVYVTTVVSKDVILKNISTELQNKIKEAMKRTADLEVKEVNVRIKNITSKKVKILPVTNSEENVQEEKEEKKAENEEIETVKENTEIESGKE